MRIASIFLAVWLFMLPTATVWAAFPDKPIRVLVGFTPGGGTDALARLVSAKLSERWGHSMLVENRPGADGDIALEALMRAAPDGYTLVFATNALTIAPAQRKVSYDPVKTFTPISLAAYSPGLLVIRQSLPVNNVKELIAYAKAKPGQLNFGSTGVGTTPYLQMALLMKLTDTSMVSVPFKGTPIAAMVAGDIDLGFSAVPASLPMVKAGKLKALGVAARARSTQLPDVPTMTEAGFPGNEASTWYAWLAPGGTAKDIVSKLYTDFTWSMKDPVLAPRIADLGFVPFLSTPEELLDILKSDTARWADLMKTIVVQ